MAHPAMALLGRYLLLVNGITFLAYGWDKKKAKRKQWRIPEHTLLFLAFAGGAGGGLLGMWSFHHKTRKLKFKICVPAALLLWVLFLAFFVARMEIQLL